MRIVTWNCGGALRKKLDVIDSLNADVLIVQECEDPDQSIPSYNRWAGNFLWKGLSKNKGVGVFAKNQTEISRLNWNRKYKLIGAPESSASATWETGELREFLPIQINGRINLVAAWTKQSNGGTFDYAGQLWKWLQLHAKDMMEGECILIGDLNSNIQWDREDRWWNHSDNVQILAGIGMRSLYHKERNIPQGNEPDPTYYMHRKLEKPYHIDYVFASNSISAQAKVQVLLAADWLKHSDHIPIVVDLAPQTSETDAKNAASNITLNP